MANFIVNCTTCGADWSAGLWTPDCEECGGGAMTIPCPTCGGQCGNVWQRAVMDSWDFQLAHWVGSCGLPPEQRQKLLRQRLLSQHKPKGDSDDDPAQN
jgi:hypothetical protein